VSLSTAEKAFAKWEARFDEHASTIKLLTGDAGDVFNKAH
jgi:hypothetical protein